MKHDIIEETMEIVMAAVDVIEIVAVLYFLVNLFSYMKKRMMQKKRLTEMLHSIGQQVS